MAEQSWKPGDWKGYFDAVAGLPPRETLVFALGRFEGEGVEVSGCRGVEEKAEAGSLLTPGHLDTLAPPLAPRLAVDLGCGDGRDAVEMLRRGWRVEAVDSEAEGIARLVARVPEPVRDRLTTRVARFEDAVLPECDLLNASFSIPHCSPADFPGLWAKIVASIRPGGRFAGQIFGVNDGWAKKPDGVMRTYHTRAEVEAMLAPFDVEMLDEVERDGKNSFGEPKYWHVFHVVARKRV